MGEIANCPNCSTIFEKTKFRDVCDQCYKEEEKMFDKVYRYIKKKENRTATVEQVLEDTGIEEELLIKFIKTGRLRPLLYPNLRYKCEKCGELIREGQLCPTCKEKMVKELKTFEAEEKRKNDIIERSSRNTYHVNDYKKRFTDND
ncbi:TIGR03826 family flagellar region protein [Bacillus massiliigorillae]|uniref:TIGR03826 family flagellar region protein n=1 Tax=Bacillus massiliigorillae TaxID=1243664 RepID=UPI0003A222CF|nr:TIGR03826 family flagellar region protein [Bacillus massiliigorillae]